MKKTIRKSTVDKIRNSIVKKIFRRNESTLVKSPSKLQDVKHVILKPTANFQSEKPLKSILKVIGPPLPEIKNLVQYELSAENFMKKEIFRIKTPVEFQNCQEAIFQQNQQKIVQTSKSPEVFDNIFDKQLEKIDKQKDSNEKQEIRYLTEESEELSGMS